MRHTIEAQFEKHLQDGVSTFTAFVRAIKNRGFDRYLIGRWFNVLVEVDDYNLEDRPELLVWLTKLSNTPSATQEMA